MASHIACHTSDILPNSFPPPKPAEREYRNFMASEYQASSLMDRSNPQEKYLDGKDSYIFDDDFPVLSKPAPTVTAASSLRNMYDPQLLVTPEKHASPGQRKTNHLPDPDLTVTPEKSSPQYSRGVYIDPDDSITELKQHTGSQRTVRFDQNVEVHQMSPVSSTLGTSPSQSGTSLDSFDSSLKFSQSEVPSSTNRSNFTRGQESLNLDENLALQERKNENEQQGEKYRPISKDSNKQHSRSVDVIFTANHQRPYSINTSGSKSGSKSGSRMVHPGSLSNLSGSSGDSSGLDSFSSHSSGEPDSIETIDIIASDLQPHFGSRSKSRKDQIERKPFSEGIVENTLARPEFSSTLRVKKEISELKDSEVDLVKAVKQKLKTSDKTNTKVKEKAYSRVNRGDDLVYTELPGIEVQNEDAVMCAEEQITSRVKPTPKTQYRPESKLQKAPDIMEFFERRFQRETASFTLPGIPTVSLEPQPAEATRAFDVYTHIRGWEGW